MTDITAIKARAEAATQALVEAAYTAGANIGGTRAEEVEHQVLVSKARAMVLAEIDLLTNERSAYKQGMDTCVEKADAALSLAQDLLRKSEDRATAAEAALAEARAENERLRREVDEWKVAYEAVYDETVAGSQNNEL